MRPPRLFSILAAGLAAAISLTSHAAPKADFSVCWTIYAGRMPWKYGGPPFRPGMARVTEGGVAIAVEAWELPNSELGSFRTGIPAPLGLGKVQLVDG